MAIFNARNSTMWVGGVGVYNLATELGFDIELQTSPSHTFGNDAETVTAGLFMVTASASGYIDFDGPFAGLNTPFENRTESVVTGGPTATEGDTALLTKGLISTWTPLSETVGETAGMNVELSGTQSVPPVDGTLIHAETARTSTANGTAYQLGAVSATQTVYSNLHVVAVSGTNPTLDVVIASDSVEGFGGSPETQLTHPEMTATGANQQSATGAVTDTWWRAQWTIGGTDTPTFTFVVAVGIA